LQCSTLDKHKDTTIISDFLAATSATSAIVTDGNGDQRFDCHNDLWIVGPGCKNDLAKCIPLVTGGGTSIWYFEEMLHQMFYHQLPWALAVAKDSQAYSDMPRNHKTLMYWWTPDKTFLTWVLSLWRCPCTRGWNIRINCIRAAP